MGDTTEDDSSSSSSSSSSISKDVRRYFCDFCSISRSKRSLIKAHILSSHQEEAEFTNYELEEKSKRTDYTCTECNANFRKPAYLRQHMQCHSLERPFVCPVEDCHQSYRRKDHLTRHSLKHEGKIFTCPVPNCGRKFTLSSNIQRHLRNFHEDNDNDCSSSRSQSQRLHVCPEPGCGKGFRYHSRLRKHMESHVKLDYVDVICSEAGCMKSFTNAKCLAAHVRSCHHHVECPICGIRHLRKNIKRHVRSHERETPAKPDKMKCPYPRCLHSFSKKSNLDKHIKVVHMELRPFVCGFSGCGLRFSYKHVRDNHEKSGVHAYVEGDFLATDERFRSKPRGGRKRKAEPVGSLLRKRIAVDDVTRPLDGLLD